MKVFFSIKARLTLWYALLMLVVTVLGLVLVALMWSVGQAALAYHEGPPAAGHGRRSQVRYGGKWRARAGQPGPGGL